MEYYASLSNKPKVSFAHLEPTFTTAGTQTEILSPLTQIHLVHANSDKKLDLVYVNRLKLFPESGKNLIQKMGNQDEPEVELSEGDISLGIADDVIFGVSTNYTENSRPLPAIKTTAGSDIEMSAETKLPGPPELIFLGDKRCRHKMEYFRSSPTEPKSAAKWISDRPKTRSNPTVLPVVGALSLRNTVGNTQNIFSRHIRNIIFVLFSFRLHSCLSAQSVGSLLSFDLTQYTGACIVFRCIACLNSKDRIALFIAIINQYQLQTTKLLLYHYITRKSRLTCDEGVFRTIFFRKSPVFSCPTDF